MNSKRRWQTCRISFSLAAVLVFAGEGNGLHAAPVVPVETQNRFESAKKEAEVVADVRVVTVVCTEAKKEDGNVRAVALQVAMQVTSVEKGPVKKNDIVVVSREVQLPAGPGPKMYGYMAQTREFPFTPGVKGSVALRWDKEGRAYTAIAGWVPDPNNDARDVPKEVGKAMSATDTAEK